MQVNMSPPPTHVPPLTHGLEAHVLFFAGAHRENAFTVTKTDTSATQICSQVIQSTQYYTYK